MGVIEGSESRSASASDGELRTARRFDRPGGRRWRGLRLLLGLGVASIGLAGVSGTAIAHGPLDHGGESVAFAVVVWLPVVAGLGGGALAIRGRRTERTRQTGHLAGLVIGVLLAVLGATFAISAVATSRWFGVAGVALGALSGLWVASGHGTRDRGGHADLALGAVSAHRLLEGVALGALYSAGAAVGLIGAVLLAGHTALETVVIGGLYATGPLQTREVGAVLLLQAGYAGGALVGFGVAGALPAWLRALALAVTGGALLIVGTRETVRAIVAT